MPPRPLLVRTAACLLASTLKAELVRAFLPRCAAFFSQKSVIGRRPATAVPTRPAGGVGIVPSFLNLSRSGGNSDHRGAMVTTRAKSGDDASGGDRAEDHPAVQVDFSAFAYDPSLGIRVPVGAAAAAESKETTRPKTQNKSTRKAGGGRPSKKAKTKEVGAEKATPRGQKRATAEAEGATPSKKARTKEEPPAPSSDAPATPKRTPSKKARTKEGPSTPSSTAPTTPKRRPRTTNKSPPSSGRRKRTPKIEPGSLAPPPNWEATYELVRELRADRSAPVDTDGGHALPERHRGEVTYRFQVLVALMLSSQTKDAVVGETMRALQRYGLDVENIDRTSPEDLNALIRKVGFHNNKTKYLKQVARILIEQYNGDIPPTAAEMMKLPGVGPKMSYIVESIVFDNTTGIGVDTHMHRMFNDLKWVDSTTPEKTREQLEGWLPRDKWAEVNVLWVGIGQETQQQKEKVLRKAIACSRPAEALGLVRKLGVDLKKEGKKYGLEEEIGVALMGNNMK